jgi:hypothetical protein
MISAMLGSALRKSDSGPGRQRIRSEWVLAATVRVDGIASGEVQRIENTIDGNRVPPNMNAKVFRVRIEGETPLMERGPKGHE